ncbi:hypothetical protein PVAP13_2NG594320 [Panicum virgatum]|uniref:Uncharacterized protein n=1 Tax=Panicum virgatum TaxID=38727 RepID=A0A8T0VT90_PANVG|nr:hypothetical protein PVAP13_2NG594320 [Panicum virgatum]
MTSDSFKIVSNWAVLTVTAAGAPGGQAMAADDLPQPNHSDDAVGLARALLPTVHHPRIEYNLPVLDVQRSQVNDVENTERVDWSTIQIVDTHDDEGRIELLSESQMCELLGLADEGTPNIPTQGHHRRMDEQGNDLELGQDIDGNAIPTNDAVPDKTQWPHVDLPFGVGAPLEKSSVERMRKLRIKGWDEGGHKKKGKSTNEGEGEKGWHEGEGDNDTVPTNAKGQKMHRGPVTCKRCGGKGHRQASSKCPLNGTAKKEKRRHPRKNRPTREQILRDSPGRVTRSMVAMLLGDDTSSQPDNASPVRMPTSVPPKKMTPKRRKLNIG